MLSQPSTAAAPPPPVRVEPCVWMSAGLVAYKLCDRGFECESCPFDQAMRGALPPGPARLDRAGGARRGGLLRPFRVGRAAAGAPTIERGSGQGGDGSRGHGVSILQRTVSWKTGVQRGGRLPGEG